jgi:excisionase family DNA binding protein
MVEAAVTALRSAIARLASLSCDWTPAEAATLGGTTEIAAVRYCHNLRDRRVLAQTSERPERYAAGPMAEEWRRQKPKTNPGGGANSYRECKALREELAARDWRARTGREPEPVALTRQDEPGRDTPRQDETGEAKVTLLTKGDAARVLGISQRGLDRLFAQGKLRRIKIGRLSRVREDDLKMIIGGGHGQTQAG